MLLFGDNGCDSVVKRDDELAVDLGFNRFKFLATRFDDFEDIIEWLSLLEKVCVLFCE